MPNNWPVATDMGTWIKHQERRMTHSERRPIPRSASDLLGPGIAATAVEILDWNGEETAFNGIFFSTPGAIHGPDISRYWAGLVIATPDGYGIQRVWEFRDADSIFPTARSWERKMVPSGGVRFFTPWVTDREDVHLVGAGGEPGFENSWINYGAAAVGFRREGDVVRLLGVAKSGTGTIFTLPVGYRPLVYEIDYTNTIRVTAEGYVRLVTDGANTFVPLGGFTFLARQ